jgi:hypothetical protein
LHRVPSTRNRPFPNSTTRWRTSDAGELLAFLDELLSYLESVRDIHGDDGGSAKRSPEIERLTQKTRDLRDAVSAERQKH